MSFMFHPHPFKDPRAVNPLPEDDALKACMTVGAIPLAKRLGEAIRGGARRVGLDGYAGAELGIMKDTLCQQLSGLRVTVVDMESLYRGRDEIRRIVAPSLPTDTKIDPVLLYGVRIERRYEDLLDAARLAALVDTLSSGGETVLVIGRGSLCETLLPHLDLRIWVDITPRQAALNYKFGRAHNLGERDALPFGEMMRRNYYVDFELAVERRWALIREGALDWYVTADDPDQPVMLPFDGMCRLFDRLRERPLRCRPVYLEGVWGGHYMKRLRRLPEEMRNCAWIFDMIPMEVSLVAAAGAIEIEVPFFTFVQQQGEKLLGREAYQRFGGYFPIRFNYDDTFHSGGNMSIQCHPDGPYLTGNHGELGAQDESYYVCVAGEGAATYLGFAGENSCAAFLADAERAQATGEQMDWRQYLNAVPSTPGTQMMIPAGTIHASGHNQVILEIGSLTMGSYTYKLYDYQRIDPLTEKPRPIHLEAGKRVLRAERAAAWVRQNLINHGGVVREDAQGRETVVGEHDLLYFSLRTLRFTKEMEGDTRGGFQVLTLTEGERVRVKSRTDPARSFAAEYLDIVVVPADFGPYVLVNEGQGTVTVHKTVLKDGLSDA